MLIGVQSLTVYIKNVLLGETISTSIISSSWNGLVFTYRLGDTLSTYKKKLLKIEFSRNNKNKIKKKNN